MNIILAFQNPQTKQWERIGKITSDKGVNIFLYDVAEHYQTKPEKIQAIIIKNAQITIQIK
jgi:hypothetical protein